MNDPKIHSNTWEWDMAGPWSPWRYSHNYRHHVLINVIGMDDDLGYGVLRVSRGQEWMPSYLLAPLRAVLPSMVFEWGIALHDLYAEQEHQQTGGAKTELKRPSSARWCARPARITTSFRRSADVAFSGHSWRISSPTASATGGRTS